MTSAPAADAEGEIAEEAAGEAEPVATEASIDTEDDVTVGVESTDSGEEEEVVEASA